MVLLSCSTRERMPVNISPKIKLEKQKLLSQRKNFCKKYKAGFDTALEHHDNMVN